MRCSNPGHGSATKSIPPSQSDVVLIVNYFPNNKQRGKYPGRIQPANKSDGLLDRCPG